MHLTPPNAVAALALAIGIAASAPALAGVSGWTRSSIVSDSVVNNGNGTWAYNYTVSNTSQNDGGPDGPLPPILVDWELPWFGDAGITNIVSPVNWTFTIETIGSANPATGWDGVASWQTPGDPFYAGPNSPYTTVSQVLHWYNVCWTNGRAVATTVAATVTTCEGDLDGAIFPDESLGGFGFTSDFGPTDAPYQASWTTLPVRSGDPRFPLGGFPNSPAVNAINATPEPSALALLAGALAAGAAAMRRRRQR